MEPLPPGPRLGAGLSVTEYAPLRPTLVDRRIANKWLRTKTKLDAQDREVQDQDHQENLP